jgi:hypothetical protein
VDLLLRQKPSKTKLGMSKGSIAFLAARTSVVLNPEHTLFIQLASRPMAHHQLLSNDRKKAEIIYLSEPVLAAGDTEYLKQDGHVALEEIHRKILGKQVSVGDIGEYICEVSASAPSLKSSMTKNFRQADFVSHLKRGKALTTRSEASTSKKTQDRTSESCIATVAE